MASDRSAAKDAIQGKSKEDPELDAAISSAHTLQLQLTQEQNRHAEKMHSASIGFFGRAFGDQQSAPTYVAFLALLIAFVGVGYCLWKAGGGGETAFTQEIADYWGKQAERLGATGAAALAYIFGRGNTK